MDITNKKIAILVDDYFEQAEFEEPLKHLKEIGAKVTVVATGTRKLQSMNHVEFGDIFEADLLIGNASVDDYDALVLPGGVVNADKLRMNETARKWVNHFTDKGKLIAAICHAPWLLVSADVVEGRRLTSFYTLQDDIRNAGAEWIDHEVVLDGNIITSRKPEDIPVFVKTIEKWFKNAPTE
jgi:protease I